MDLPQRYQNQLMRILAGATYLQMPTTELLEATRMLSKSQFAFVATATVVNKAVTEGKPQWLVDQLHPVQAKGG